MLTDSQTANRGASTGRKWSPRKRASRRPRKMWLVGRMWAVNGVTEMRSSSVVTGRSRWLDVHTMALETDMTILSPDSAKCKYKLRQSKKLDMEGGDSMVVGPKKRGPKPRLRSAGMSRYRRKEANARERQRQGEINTSFDKLREKIPHPGPTNGKCEKLRKIDILHVAINYIR